MSLKSYCTLVKKKKKRKTKKIRSSTFKKKCLFLTKQKDFVEIKIKTMFPWICYRHSLCVTVVVKYVFYCL